MNKKYIEDKNEIIRLLNIESLYRHIEKDFEDFINKRPENRQEERIIQLLKRYKESSTSGNPEARNIIKSHIKTNLLTSFNLYGIKAEDEISNIIKYENIKIEEENGLVEMIMPFNNPEDLSSEEKFIVLLYYNRTVEKNGRDGAFKSIVNEFDHYYKQRETEEYKSIRYEYNAEDINNIYDKKCINLSFDDKVEIIVQMLYQKLFGLMCLDSLAYSDVNEVGFANDGKYIYCWCEKKIWLSFLTLSQDEARVVQNRCISFDKSIGQLDRNNPEKLCHRADGARITVTQPPYFSSRNLCIRIFNKSHATYDELETCDKLRKLTTALIKTGESICIQGGLGTGKTTKMEAMFEILDDNLHIGTIEDYFEQHIMQRYINKRIVEAQSTNKKSMLDSVKTLLRMSVDVADLGEVRDGDALFAFIQLVQSVSVAAWFTTHIVNPQTTVPRLKNMLMGTGRYLSEHSAIMDIIHYINIVFQHEIVNGKRIISQVVEIVPLIATSFDGEEDVSMESDLEELKKRYYIQQIKAHPSNMYRLNTILKTVDGQAVFVNYPSIRMQDKAMKNIEASKYMNKLLTAIKEDIEHRS